MRPGLINLAATFRVPSLLLDIDCSPSSRMVNARFGDILNDRTGIRVMTNFGKSAGIQRVGLTPRRTTAPATQTSQSSDNRRAPRKTTRTLAHVVCAASGQSLDCLIQDMSASGARLQLLEPVRGPFQPAMKLPETFKLVIPNDAIEIDGTLAWVRGESFGVVFKSAFRPARQD